VLEKRLLSFALVALAIVLGAVFAGLNRARAQESDRPEIAATGLDGVNIEAAHRGIFVVDAGWGGVSVFNSGGDGMYVGFVDGDGLKICATGGEIFCGLDGGKHGLEIGNALDQGVRVTRSGHDGVFVQNAGNSGFTVINAASNGLYVDDAGYYGVFLNNVGAGALRVNSSDGHGVFVNTAVDDGLWVGASDDNGVDVRGDNFAGFFFGDIAVTGSCVGCQLATFALNEANEPLMPGDVVTVFGVRASQIDGADVLLGVGPARDGQPPVGAVQGRAEVVIQDEIRPGESGRRLVPREGLARPGDYVTLVTHGPMQVRASADGGPIPAGARLTLNADGVARSLRTATVEGIAVAEDAPVLGIALEDLEAGEDLVWVLVTLR